MPRRSSVEPIQDGEKQRPAKITSVRPVFLFTSAFEALFLQPPPVVVGSISPIIDNHRDYVWLGLEVDGGGGGSGGRRRPGNVRARFFGGFEVSRERHSSRKTRGRARS